MTVVLELTRPARPVIEVEHASLREATEVIVQNHYLRRGRTMAQLPYWITLDGNRCGVLLYSLPRLSSRSAKFGGHSPMQLLELARMWIDPAFQDQSIVDSQGQSHSLPIASRAISQSIKCARQDWVGKYPHLPEPLAVVAWSDRTRHTGTIYRAANFRHVGTSGGTGHRNNRRRNGGSDQLRADYLNPKDAYLFDYARPLSSAQRTRAMADWDGIRPVRRHKPDRALSDAPATVTRLAINEAED